jgi:hypothetical protein
MPPPVAVPTNPTGAVPVLPSPVLFWRMRLSRTTATEPRALKTAESWGELRRGR